MNLKEFIKETLTEIVEAVDESSKASLREIKLSSKNDARTIEFDVAVSVEEVDSKQGKAGIKVLKFAEAGGEIGRESKNSTVSRISFGVVVDALTKEEVRESMRQISEMN